MATVKLRKVGGSTIVAIPPALLDELRIGVDAEFDLTVTDGALVMRPHRHRYTLAELLARCNLGAAFTTGEREWADAVPVGLEILVNYDDRPSK